MQVVSADYMAYHKQLLLLGLLLNGPRHGYELNRALRAHGVLYADLKKANVYYLLGRMDEDGFVRVEAQESPHGIRGEKLIYSITDEGRLRFDELLRETLRRYESVHTGLEVAVVLLNQLDPSDAVFLLEERRRNVEARRDSIVREFAPGAPRSLPLNLASDHMLATVDAEIAWVDRALERLRSVPPGGTDRG
jgi:DNA-binding PadR family transcriptional regulator